MFSSNKIRIHRTDSALVQGSDGSFYGTTVNGGRANGGTVFRVARGVYIQSLAMSNREFQRVAINASGSGSVVLDASTDLSNSTPIINLIDHLCANSTSNVARGIVGFCVQSSPSCHPQVHFKINSPSSEKDNVTRAIPRRRGSPRAQSTP